MSPPELARDAPVVDVGHPIQVDGLVILGRETDVPLSHGTNRLIRQRLNLDEPLRREARLHNSFATVALADRDYVVFDAHEKSLRLKIGEHARARLVAVESSVRAAVRVDARRLVHDLQ